MTEPPLSRVPMIPYQIRLPPDLMEYLVEEACRLHVPTAQIIRTAIREQAERLDALRREEMPK